MEDAVNYPLLRTFHGNFSYADEPQYDVTAIHRNWAVADSGTYHLFNNSSFAIPLDLDQPLNCLLDFFL